MIEINDNTVGVQSEADLRSAVADAAINYIYLAENITMTSGITISSSKASLVIDGEYPIDSGTIHVFTDTNSIDYGAAIGIRTTSSITLTFRNMIINGRNYFGVPYIVENGIYNTTGVSVLYENVTYSGPQMTYNRYGRTRYTNCDITITENGVAPMEEVGEVNRLEFDGVTTIRHHSPDDAVFWFNNLAGTSSLTVLSGAKVEIESENSYFMYNHDGLITAPVSYTLQPGASFSLRVNKGMCFSDSHPVSSFLVDVGASFDYVQTANNGSYATLYLGGALEVRQGARFYMEAANGTQPLLRFTSGASRSLTVNNPLSFVLYSPGAAVASTAGTFALTLRGGQINAWRTARTPVTSAGGFDDMPQFKWFKRDYAQPAEFIGTVSTTATTGTSNMTTEDEPHPANSDMNLASTRVLSVGDWEVAVDTVVDDGSPITGQTEPYANLIIRYIVDGVAHSINGAAMEDGSFTIATSSEEPPTIPVDTVITIESNIPFLIKQQTETVVAVGELAILSAPEQMFFATHPILFDPTMLPRDDGEYEVVVRDTREVSSQWELLASITGPLRSEDGRILTDALVFVATEGAAPQTLGSEPIVVFTGGPNEPETAIGWPERAGILVRVTDRIYSGVTYRTYIVWEVRAI